MNKKGFNLIELVLVILVIGIASTGLATVLQQAIRDTHRPEIMSTAVSLAVNEADRVMKLTFTNVVNENRDAPLSYTGNFSNYSRQVRRDSIDTAQPNLGSDPTMQNYKMVEVRVHHSVINYISLKFLRTNH